MQVLQDRVIADSLLVCLWQQEKLSTVIAQSSFHRAFRDTADPHGPSSQRVWEDGAKMVIQKDVSSLPP